MSQLFVGISTRSTDPSKITPLIVCTLSSISYEIKGKKSDFFCLSSRDSYQLRHREAKPRRSRTK